MLPNKFRVDWPFGMILASFDLQVTTMLPNKFRVNRPFGSGEEVKSRFSRWPSWRPSWISDWNDFSYFYSTSHPDDSYHVSSQFAHGCGRSGLLKQSLTQRHGRRMTEDQQLDIDWPQQLTLSTSCYAQQCNNINWPEIAKGHKQHVFNWLKI